MSLQSGPDPATLPTREEEYYPSATSWTEKWRAPPPPFALSTVVSSFMK